MLFGEFRGKTNTVLECVFTVLPIIDTLFYSEVLLVSVGGR